MRDKIRNLSEIKEILEGLRKQGKKIATTNGSFDLLHIGHIYNLESAKRLADVLIVLLNSDSSIKRLKGNNRPIIPQRERAEMLSALECIDYVIIFEEDDPLHLIIEIKPEIHIKGGSYIPERILEEKRILESFGGRHITLPIIEGYSTTTLINDIIKNYSDKN